MWGICSKINWRKILLLVVCDIILSFIYIGTSKVKASNTPKESSTVSLSNTNWANHYGNFRLDEGLPVKYIKIQVPKQNNKYLKVSSDESLSYTSDSKEATTFAVYITSPESSKGYEIKPTVQFQDTQNGKYLSIESYNKNEGFFNTLKDGTTLLKDTASSAEYNERFSVNYNSANTMYTISTHLGSIRDDKSFTTYYVNSSLNSGLQSSTSDNVPEYFEFIPTNPDGKVQLISNTVGSSATIYWKRLYSDDSAKDYSASNGANIIQKGNLFSISVPLSEKPDDISIAYNRDGKSKMSGSIIVKSMRHPGIYVNDSELNAMKKHIIKKENPWYADYLLLKNSVAYNQSSFNYKPNVVAAIGRGDQPSSNNISYFEQSGNAVYFNSLEWVITGDNRYAQTAASILDSWSTTLKVLDGRDRILGAGLNCVKFATAAEILSSYNGGFKGYSVDELHNLQKMMINVIYPDLQDVGVAMQANGNWDLAAINGLMAIGVICDNYQIYQQALNYENDSFINGSINNYISDSGQTVESGRDMAHAQLGVGLTAEIFQTAYNQGNDLFASYNNRLAKASEWIAEYNLTYKTPSFSVLPNVYGRTDSGSYWTKMDSETISRGELRPIYELILAHYADTGVSMKYTKEASTAMRPQGFVNTDNYNFDTLTFYNGPAYNFNPVFKMRERLEPWYNRHLTGNKNPILNYEPYTSYYSVGKGEDVFANKRESEADKFKLITNLDGTYSILDLTNNKYLNIGNNYSSNKLIAVEASSSTINDNSKFILSSNGLGFYSLAPKLLPTRLLETNVINPNSPTDSILQLVVGTNTLGQSVANQNRFVFMYIYDNTQYIDKSKLGVSRSLCKWESLSPVKSNH